MAESKTDNKTVSLFEELNVSNERAHEINIEIHALFDNSDTINELLHSIPAKYDRESIIAGVFLCERILDNEGRLLSAGMIEDIVAELLSELESGDIRPRDIMVGDPNRIGGD